MSFLSQAKNLVLQLLYKRIILILLVLFIIGIAITVGGMLSLSSGLIESQALHNAKVTALTLQQARSVYSSEVLDRLQEVPQVTITHNYLGKFGAVPLPVNYLKQLSLNISEKDNSAISTRLYSRYPFPGHTPAETSKDDFETAALKYLEQNPQEIFYRIEKLNGRKTLRYAEPDIMKASCVRCHNSHPDSPKKDWQVGQVRGVLEVKQPIERIVLESRQDLTAIALKLGIVAILSLSGLTLAISKFKLVNKELSILVKNRTAQLTTANSELIQVRKQITQLQIQVDRKKHQKEVNEIVNSDNFDWIFQQGKKWRGENLDSL